ncbi:MAG: hypothetical protein HKN23_16840 [Verrucomicrobiales bacterium]|nr:hypothetical protein [Verrucomicrobiales bacterium]
MKRIVFSTVLWVVAAVSTPAQDGDKRYAKDLEKLKAEYRVEVEEALDPVKKRYKHNLETLLKRSTFDNDLDTAVKVRQELKRLRNGNAGQPESPFVGQWEYKQSGNTYRRIVRDDGSVELWKNGKEWMKNERDLWWDGFTWIPAGDGKIEILNGKGEKYLLWTLSGKDEVTQREINRTGDVWKLKRASSAWK